MKPGGARTKGASAEREVIKLLEPIVREEGGGLLFRNLEQVRSGGHDIIGLDWLAIEVKRCETLAVDAWWAQAVQQAGADRIPVLIYRQSRKAWTVVMWGGVTAPDRSLFHARVTITFYDFQQWLRYQLQNRRAAA